MATTPTPAPAAGQTIEVTFRFAEATELVTAQRAKGFPSYVLGGGGDQIVIDPLPTSGDLAAMQTAINHRAAALATVAQALGLASSQLADAIAALPK